MLREISLILAKNIPQEALETEKPICEEERA